MNKYKNNNKQKEPGLPSGVKQTRNKIKKLLPKCYELRCEIQDDFEFHYPLNFEFLNNKPSIKYSNKTVDFSMRDKLAEEYIRTILYAYDELIYMYAYSLAADEISKKLEKAGEDGLSAYWEFIIRNSHFRDFIPKFYSFLDYLAFMINELSEARLIPKNKKEPRRLVCFSEVEKALEKNRNITTYIGWLSHNDRESILDIFKKPFKNINEAGKKILKRYRDIITHRYLPVIDEMTISSEIPSSKVRTSEYGKLYSIKADEKTYDYYGGPEFKFLTLSKISKILLVNLTEILNNLASLEVIESVIKLEKF